jgi:hypothetical protein
LQTQLFDATTNGVRDINHWLGSNTANPRLGEVTDLLGAATRFYPSTVANVMEPAYTWCTAYRLLDTNMDTVPDSVQFFVFVSRRSTATPVVALIDVPPSTNPGVLPQWQIPLPMVTPATPKPVEWYANAFSEGQILISGMTGDMIKIQEIDPINQLLTVDRNLNATAAPITYGFVFIPVDPNTNRSPVVAVYARTFPLD